MIAIIVLMVGMLSVILDPMLPFFFLTLAVFVDLFERGYISSLFELLYLFSMYCVMCFAFYIVLTYLLSPISKDVQRKDDAMVFTPKEEAALKVAENEWLSQVDSGKFFPRKLEGRPYYADRFGFSFVLSEADLEEMLSEDDDLDGGDL